MSIKNIIKKFFSKKEVPIALALFVLFLILSITTESFLTVENLLNIGRQISILGIVSAGMGMLLICGQIDISVGSVYALSAIITAKLLISTGNTILALLGGLAVGLIIGLINGFMIIKIGMPAFIATFGMLNIARGICLILTEGYPITLFVQNINQVSNPGFFFIGQGLLFGIIPMEFIFMIAVFIIIGLLLHKTNFGIHTYAIGNNKRACFVSGIKVDSISYILYILTSILASLAGILGLSFIGSISPTSGDGLEFEVLAAIVIGGVSFAGGEGSIFGIILGVILFGVIRNGLILLGIGQFWQVLIIGLVTVGAVAYDSINVKIRSKRGV